MRWVRTRVLPEPAPATISSGPSPWTTASRWAGLSPDSRGDGSWTAAVTGAAAVPERDGRRARRPAWRRSTCSIQATGGTRVEGRPPGPVRRSWPRAAWPPGGTRPGRTSCGSRRPGRTGGKSSPTGAARGRHRDLGVVQLVDQLDEQQGAPLVLDRVQAPDEDGVEAVEQGGELDRVDPPEVGQEVVEAVDGHAALGRLGQRGQPVVVQGGGLDAAALAVVRAVDAHGLEVDGDGGDLPGEVVGVEPALAEAVGQGVRGGRHPHPVGDDPPQEADRQQRVGHVVELELVDAEQAGRRERRHGRLHAEEAHGGGQLLEAQVLGRHLGRVPERGQQVGLAHPVAPVQVATGAVGLGRDPAPAAPAPARLHGDHRRREGLHGLLGRSLARVVGIGPVGREAHAREAPGRHEAGQQLPGPEGGDPVDEVLGPGHPPIVAGAGHGAKLRGRSAGYMTTDRPPSTIRTLPVM